MFDKILEIFEGEGDQTSIFGLLRLVRFDSDPQQPVKPFQKYLGVSYSVEDVRGNPGSTGNFFVTNLRMIWQMKSDPGINLSFGWDSIITTDVKSLPATVGDGFKHILTLKVQNPSQTRYQFKFSGFHRDDLKVFQKVSEIHKKTSKTRQYRATNITLKFQQNFQPLQNQQLKSTYQSLTFVEEQKRTLCKVFVTDTRIVIIRQGEKRSNMGIVWIMIRGIQYSAESDMLKGIRIHCRGLMASRVLFLYGANSALTKKLHYELKSFCEIYNKTPILGFSYEAQKLNQQKPKEQVPEIEQFQTTKVNLGRRKNAYASSGETGSIQHTTFNNEIGLMMQKLPEGVEIADLWEILR